MPSSLLPSFQLAVHLSIRGFLTAVLFFPAVYDGNSPQKLIKVLDHVRQLMGVATLLAQGLWL